MPARHIWRSSPRKPGVATGAALCLLPPPAHPPLPRRVSRPFSPLFMDFLSMDGDEVSTATMCPTMQCTSCWCPREQLQDSDHVFPFRDTQAIHAELETLLNQDGTARDRCKDRARFWWHILCLYFIYAWHIPCIYYVYQRILNWISIVYVMYIPCKFFWICITYTMHVLCISKNFKLNIHCICLVYPN